jgi:hypothetical protein
MKTFKQLSEELADWALNTPLLEMAVQRKELIGRVVNLQDQIALHAVKLVLYPNDTSRRGWLNEVRAWLGAIQRLQYARNKRLPAEQYFKILWAEPFENTDFLENCVKYPKEVLDMYRVKLTNSELIEIDLKIRNIYLDISNHLASSKPKDFRECFE